TLDTIYTSSAWYSVSEISATVPPGDSVTVQVNFAPGLTPGILLDTLIVTGDDLDNPELHIPLSGESVWPVLELSETDLSFGDIRVGITETMQLTLSNTGSDTLFVDSIYVADDLSGFSVALVANSTSRSLFQRIAPALDPGTRESEQQRSIQENSGIRVATDILPGESIGLDVSFTRADTAMVDDQLRITSDDPLGNETVTISLSAHSVAPALVLETDLLDFSNASGDSTVTVALSNTGTDTLNISGLSVSPAVFSQVLSDSILEPGAAANLLVSFSPPSRGYWEGALVITSDNYQASESSLELRALSYTSTGFDLGDVPVGLSSGHVYTLENTGNTNLFV
ncbi:uncharacterized protein METZ01_LOCUS328009, partial [marine metagenome]